MKELDYKVDLTNKNPKNFTIGIDPYHDDIERYTTAICVIEKTSEGDNVVKSAVAYYSKDSLEEKLRMQEELQKYLHFYKDCIILEENEENQRKFREKMNKPLDFNKLREKIGDDKIIHYKGEFNKWLNELDKHTIPYPHLLTELINLKENKMEPETRSILTANLKSQEEKLEGLKLRKEHTIKELCHVQNELEKQEKHLSILKHDLDKLDNTKSESSNPYLTKAYAQGLQSDINLKSQPLSSLSDIGNMCLTRTTAIVECPSCKFKFSLK